MLGCREEEGCETVHPFPPTKVTQTFPPSFLEEKVSPTIFINEGVLKEKLDSPTLFLFPMKKKQLWALSNIKAVQLANASHNSVNMLGTKHNFLT